MIFVMRGTVCSGKSTFVKDNFKPYENVISSDDMRIRFTGDRHCQTSDTLVFQEIHKTIEYRLLNKVKWTVFDATNIKIKSCRDIIELSKKYHASITFISIIPPDLEELKRRNNQRSIDEGFYVPEDVIERMYNNYQSSTQGFVMEAMHNPYCTFIELDQNHEVVRMINGKD